MPIPSASETFDLTVIAVHGQRAGLLSRQDEGYRFHASHRRFDGLDGRYFPSIGEARSAASQFAATAPLGPNAHKPWP